MTIGTEMDLRQTPEQEPGPLAIITDLDRTCAVARSAIESLREIVRSVLLATRTGDEGIALRGLATWYERMCVDPDYANPPPDGGIAELNGLSDLVRFKLRLMVAYRAVRVADELSASRRRRFSSDSTPEELHTVLARLELALHSLSEQL